MTPQILTAKMESKVDLEGKEGSFWFLHPVVIFWSQENESKSISHNALIDTSADISLFNVKFIEEQIVPWRKNNTRTQMRGADNQLLRGSGIAYINNITINVQDANTGKTKSLQLRIETAALGLTYLLILGLDWLT